MKLIFTEDWLRRKLKTFTNAGIDESECQVGSDESLIAFIGAHKARIRQWREDHGDFQRENEELASNLKF